ncbi:MAG: hypothetical protein JOY71_23360 [Acetobacteraceae bacterium]|nr:hypothetical protein [Acetobacteraceae bacterium]MBV8525022.1 hypothetical protein [Acetobacteraceae bacterium]MBV8591063.1 hypothetical protein [Acetobacteraceae bacterium]
MKVIVRVPAGTGKSGALTLVQRRLIEAAALQEAQDLLFQHTVLCQTCLPYRDPGDDVREWGRINGKVHLEIAAGKAMHPILGRRVPVGLPFGAKSRLVLTHLNTEAVRTGSSEIEVGSSLAGFVRQLKLDAHGRNMTAIKDQLTRLSAASIGLGIVHEGQAITVNAHIVTAFSLWPPNDERQRVFWPQTVRLSQEYFDSLQRHAVPLDEGAIRALAHSAMALDIYAWLAQRLHRIARDKPQFVPWAALHEQFGFHYSRIRKFREVFLEALRQVAAVYPEARVGEELNRQGKPAGLVLYNSPTPVPKLMVSVRVQDCG